MPQVCKLSCSTYTLLVSFPVTKTENWWLLRLMATNLGKWSIEVEPKRNFIPWQEDLSQNILGIKHSMSWQRTVSHEISVVQSSCNGVCVFLLWNVKCINCLYCKCERSTTNLSKKLFLNIRIIASKYVLHTM